MVLSRRRHTFSHKQTLKFQKIDKRAAEGAYERLTNRLQVRLIRAYDIWVRGTTRELQRAIHKGLPVSYLQGIANSRVDELLANLTPMITSGVVAAGTVGVGRVNARKPVVQGAIHKRIGRETGYLHSSLGPDIKQQMKVAGTDVPAIKPALDANRARVGSYAGAAWATIFESQMALGKEQERENNESQRIRWVLDPMAVHCKPAGGRRGCLELAGEYDNWNALPVVPAGEVTCAGNCRCHLEIFIDGDWRRGGL